MSVNKKVTVPDGSSDTGKPYASPDGLSS
jgi:hypothetical protein